MSNISEDILELSNVLPIIRREGIKPAWSDSMITETVECYRRDFHMNPPKNIRVLNQHPEGSIERLTVSRDPFSYMSPLQILRPRFDKMDVIPVKVEYMNIESLVDFRRVDPNTGMLIESIDDRMHRDIIVKLLERILPDSEYGEGVVERLTRPEYIDNLWIPVFTHKSYNPNVGQNYEKFEYVGDAVMGLAFRTYLLKLFPDYQEGEYTAMSSHYLSTPEQAKLAENLQLIAAIRTNVIPDRPMAEDVMEAFYGALYHILPMRIINKFTENIYSDLGIDPIYRHQDPKTNVLQYFDRRHIAKPIESHETLDDGRIVTSLIVTRRDALNDLLRYLPDLEYDSTREGYIIARGDPSNARRTSSMSSYMRMSEIITTLGTFDMDVPSLQDRYRRCLDTLYGESHTDYTPVVIGGGAGSTSMAIQATNRKTGLLDNILTMKVPVGSAAQRRNATSTFLESICQAIESQIT